MSDSESKLDIYSDKKPTYLNYVNQVDSYMNS